MRRTGRLDVLKAMLVPADIGINFIFIKNGLKPSVEFFCFSRIYSTSTRIQWMVADYNFPSDVGGFVSQHFFQPFSLCSRILAFHILLVIRALVILRNKGTCIYKNQQDLLG